MAETLAAPVLMETLGRLIDRERRRARDAALRRTLAATAVAVLIGTGWRVADRVLGREPMPLAGALGLVAVVAAVGLAFALRGARGRSEQSMAHEMDRRLGLDDRAAAALAVLSGGAESRLAAYVVSDVEASLGAVAGRVDTAFPAKAERRVTAPVRWLAKGAALAVVLAALAELLAVGGPVRVLPGVPHDNADETAAVPPTGDAPRQSGGRPETPETPKPDAPEEQEPDEPAPPKEQGDIGVALRMAKDEFDDKEPIGASIAATARGDIGGPRKFDVRLSVDGVEVDTGEELTVDPARPEGARTGVDLRTLPGLKLPPGEHEALARLTTRTSHEAYASKPLKFRIRAPKKDDDPDKGNAPPKPKPEPKPEPQQPPPPPKPEEPPKPDEPQPVAPLPPAVTEKHLVTPLFGEGEKVKKKGLILVLDPGGGTAAPVQRPLDEALAEAARRAEAAVDLARVPAEDKELVRRYFELLGDLRK